MNRALLATLLTASLGLLSFAVRAETGLVTASVIGVCKFSVNPGVAFDVMNPVPGLQFWCTKGAAYSVATEDTSALSDANKPRAYYNAQPIVRQLSGPKAPPNPMTSTATSGPATSGLSEGKSAPITVTVEEERYRRSQPGPDDPDEPKHVVGLTVIP